MTSGPDPMHTVQAHGAEIPALGFGTWELTGDEAVRATVRALDVGYRHIDTAQIYGNEAEVGRALAESPVARDDVFLTTKVWVEHHGRREMAPSVEESLRKLGTDRVDLLLLHWPSRDLPLTETLEALAAVRERGLTRHIGVSNFTPSLLAEAISLSPAPLVTNQVEYHPFLDQQKVLRATREAGMALTAYSPIARGRVMESEALREIGARHGKSPAQVAIRWLLQQEGVATIPKAARPEHCEENFGVFDFALDEGEMQAIHGLAEPGGRMVSPEGVAPDWE